jgi:hypothetical protein
LSTANITGFSATASEQLDLEASGYTNLNVLYDDTNGNNGWKASATAITIPFYTDANQYIVFKEVFVPNGQDLSIALNYTNTTTGASAAAKTITMSFDGGANDHKITMDGFTTSQSLAGQDANYFDLHVWIDPTADKVDMLYVNNTTGQGPQQGGVYNGVAYYKDIKHISYTNRLMTTIADANIRSISLSQARGTGAKIERIVVCRKPIVLIGDSYTSSWYAYPSASDPCRTMLAGVGVYLDDSNRFTQPHYVINGGVTGNSVSASSNGFDTAMITRFDDPCTHQDLIAYRDTIYVLGCGINDVTKYIGETGTAADAYASAQIIAGATMDMIGKMKRGNYGGSRDVIYYEQVPYGLGTNLTNKNLCMKMLYKIMKYNCYYLQVPYVETYTKIPSGYYEAAGVHPLSDGYDWIARQIAQVYENFSPNQQCNHDLYGDLNRDCIVDFYDFSDMVSNWLIDCQAEPNNPQCE